MAQRQLNEGGSRWTHIVWLFRSFMPVCKQVKREGSAVLALQASVRGLMVRSQQSKKLLRQMTQQVGGHPGALTRLSDDKVSKNTSRRELIVYQALQGSDLARFMPLFYGFDDRPGALEKDHYVILQIQDVTADYKKPCVMDIKMGTRTFLESEVTNQTLRPDLAEKLYKLNPHAVTADELKDGVTKLRYMQCREQTSSTSLHGWRIEGISCPNLKIETKKVREYSELQETLEAYLRGSRQKHHSQQGLKWRLELQRALLQQMIDLKAIIEASVFFSDHEFVGSSLLFVYDDDNCYNAAPGVWMIDFAKTMALKAPDTKSKRVVGAVRHRIPWELGNQEDGYLLGLDSLIDTWRGIGQRLVDSDN
eukprot:CAMPEP_0119316922 /NCGR_PEP_ID=MMETSP1333-20130426/41381_1 /TAXON_ID=418940 /ORGANISM="Scyphosphaera apsteinii, Strain RCC1455" /LENGTH=364 /DNA_ID=CAMNT_0007322703 /DNA_START=221 /DNA_END=1315 /DNA_ORIENTATION=-